MFSAIDSRRATPSSTSCEDSLGDGVHRSMHSDRHSQSSSEGTSAFIIHRIANTVHSQWSVVRKHPYVLVIPALVFVVLCATGLALIYGLNDDNMFETSEEMQVYVQDIGKEVGDWFAQRFSRAIQPALALSQVVNTYAVFRRLPRLIGSYGQEGSLPFYMAEDGSAFLTEDGSSIRNVTGVCDTDEVTTRYKDVAGPLIASSGVEEAIRSLKLAPQGVICLTAYRDDNSQEDQTASDNNGRARLLQRDGSERPGDGSERPGNGSERPGDGSGRQGDGSGRGANNETIGGTDGEGELVGDGAQDESLLPEAFDPEELPPDLGVDLLTASRAQRYFNLLSSGEVNIRIVQGDETEQGIDLLIPVKSDEHLIEFEGESYPGWGMVMMDIDWTELVRTSPIWKAMQDFELEFRLYQVTRRGDNDTGRIVTLLESPGFANRLGLSVVVVDLDLQIAEWKMEVAYEFEETKPWMRWATIVCVVLSFSIGMASYLVLLHLQMQAISDSEKTALVVESAKLSAKKERELNEFLAHEVRNPVSAAISACNFVSSAVNETEPLTDPESIQCVRDDVNIIQTSLQFVNDLLRTMLDIHRADSKLLKVERSATDIRMDVFDPVACMIHQHESMYRVEVECPEGLVIETDRMRLKQIILNLGRNSSKFVEKGFVRLRAVIEDGCLFLYVEDSGPGIPEERRQKLFKKFQDSLDSLNQGTGVGLHLCRSLVELLDGEIWLDGSYHSGVDGCPGARFVVRLDGVAVLPSDSTASETLPSGSSDHELSDASSRRDDVHGKVLVSSSLPGRSLPDHLRVLFVDDDTVLRKLFVRAVKKVRGEWIIEEASSGEAALTMVEHSSYDVIFVDQYMASVTKSLLGTETVRALRGKGVTNRICGLSANDMEGAFVAAGANTFLMKPFPCKKDELTVELLRILYDSSFPPTGVV